MQSLPVKDFLLSQDVQPPILNKSSALSLRVSPSNEIRTVKMKGRPQRHFRNALSGTTSSNMINSKRQGNITSVLLSPKDIRNLGKS